MRDHKILSTICLSLLGIATLPFYALALQNGDHFLANPAPFSWILIGLTVLYIAACAMIWFKADTGRISIQLIIIIVIGLMQRSVLWNAIPTLSHDAFRYVWDAHQVIHGISPYLHTPTDTSIAWLRDTSIWPNVNWRDAPTIYPPGAQFFYLLIYKIAPLNIFAMKAGIAICDILVGALTTALLWFHGHDLRRVILYWWSPIPILEFAWSAHVDAVALLWMLSAVLIWHLHDQPRAPEWLRSKRNNSMLVGILLGLATLTKLYPILFAIVLWRRDKAMPLALLGSILLGYLPFMRLGLGGGGFLGTYFSQRFPDQGIALRLLAIPVVNLGGSQHMLILAQFILLGSALLGVAWWQYRVHLSPEMGILVISVVWILFSPHLFPWYVAALLPFLAVTGENVKVFISGKYRNIPTLSLQSRSFSLAIWIFVLLMPFTYIIFAPDQPSWLFIFFFIIPGIVAIAPLFPGSQFGKLLPSPAYRE
jgi:hypothetical protein